jgi:hypothetical protein
MCYLKANYSAEIRVWIRQNTSPIGKFYMDHFLKINLRVQTGNVAVNSFQTIGTSPLNKKTFSHVEVVAAEVFAAKLHTAPAAP